MIKNTKVLFYIINFNIEIFNVEKILNFVIMYEN